MSRERAALRFHFKKKRRNQQKKREPASANRLHSAASSSPEKARGTGPLAQFKRLPILSGQLSNLTYKFWVIFNYLSK